MLIDPLPIKLEQELKYEIAYAALSSAAADGRLPTRQCWLCPEMRRFVPRYLVVLVNSFWVAFRVCCM